MSKKRRKKQEVQNQSNLEKPQLKENQKIINSTENICDESPYVYQKSKLKVPLNIRKRNDLTDNQIKLIDLILNKETKVVFVSGPAGTSKTFCAILSALQLISDRKVSDIIYVRSLIESAEKSMGHLKGSEFEKLHPYTLPLMDKLGELLPKGESDMLLKEQRVCGQYVGFLRGQSFSAQFLLIDETQNFTFNEIFTTLTRIGQFSKMVLCGDETQSDIGNKSGFTKMISIFDDEESRSNGIHCFKFTESDIVRSEIVKFIVKKVKK